MEAHPELILFLAVGNHPSKSSLLTRLAHENRYSYTNCNYNQDTLDRALTQAEEQAKSVILDNPPPYIGDFSHAEGRLDGYRVVLLKFKRKGDNVDEYESIVKHYKKLGELKEVQLAEGNSLDEYKELKRTLLSKVVFVYGPPRSGKTELAHKIGEALGYKYVSFEDLKKQLGATADEIGLVNKLVKFLSSTSENMVIDGFFKSKLPLTVLGDYMEPAKVYHLLTSNDEVQLRLQGIKDKQLKANKTRQFEEYLDNKDEVVGFLKHKTFFENVTADSLQNTLIAMKPQLLYVKCRNGDFIQKLAQDWQGTHFDIQRLIAALTSRGKADITDTVEAKLGYLKKVIGSTNGRVVLSGFSEQVEDFVQLENAIGEIKFYFAFADQDTKYSEALTPEMYYLRKQKLIPLEVQNTSLVLSFLDSRNPYLLISGPETSGKSSIAKIIARDYGYTHIEFEPYLTEYKEKNPSEEGEDLSFAKTVNIFKQLISSNKNKYILEGLPYEGKELTEWIKEVGYPTAINLKIDNDNWINRYRKKNEVDLSSELTEEDQERLTAAQQKNTNYSKSIEGIYEKHPNIKLFQFDVNSALIALENFLPLILRPRVFVVSGSQSQSTLFLNIALKYKMSFIDLSETDLREVPSLLGRGSTQRDIVLYNYSSKDRFVSDDVYFIERFLGTVRVVCLCTEEDREFNDQKMVLERPVVQSKRRREPEEGQEGEQPQLEEAPAEQEELDDNGQAKKPKLDIFNFDWTQPGSSKNLSQWFLHWKKPIKEYPFEQSKPQQIYEDFELVISDLNRDRSINIYSLIR